MHDYSSRWNPPREDESGLVSELIALSSFLTLPIELQLEIILNLAYGRETGHCISREVDRQIWSRILLTSAHSSPRQLSAFVIFSVSRIALRVLSVNVSNLNNSSRCNSDRKEGFGSHIRSEAVSYELWPRAMGTWKRQKSKGGFKVDHYKILCRESLKSLDEPERIPNRRIISFPVAARSGA